MKFIRYPSAPVDVNSISSTIAECFQLLYDLGPEAVEPYLSNIQPSGVSGEHLAAVLRITHHLPYIPSWAFALEVCRQALIAEGKDPEDALFGLI